MYHVPYEIAVVVIAAACIHIAVAVAVAIAVVPYLICLLYTSPSPRD